MLKNVTQIIEKINDKDHKFECEFNTPIEDVKEALFRFLKFVGQVEDQGKAQQEAVKKAQEEAETAQKAKSDSIQPEENKVEALEA